tara:strand:+ start:463 stop:882 length:420 start_codon:yes stop_codon:yes gene_type:complete
MENISDIIDRTNNIAIVGLSKNPDKDSHRIAEFLLSKGYEIIPVNPSSDEILGLKCYSDLLDIPVEIAKTIDMVNVFRKSSEVQSIVEKTLRMRLLYNSPKYVWTQLGIYDQSAANDAQKVGLSVVMNKCIMIEINKLT